MLFEHQIMLKQAFKHYFVTKPYDRSSSLLKVKMLM